MAQSRNQAVNLDSGQLPALTRFGALRHLDLDFLAAVEIFGSDTKTARSHLLDGA